MHVHTLKPKDQTLGWPCNHQAPSQFFLDFSKQLELPRNFLALIFHGSTHTNPKFAPYFTPFLFKERARKLPWVFLSSPPIHKPKERQDSISFLIHTFSKKLEDSKTLSSSLPLILLGPTTRKGTSFHARVIYFYFPSRTINLVRILATLTLESMISLKNFW